MRILSSKEFPKGAPIGKNSKQLKKFANFIRRRDTFIESAVAELVSFHNNPNSTFININPPTDLHGGSLDPDSTCSSSTKLFSLNSSKRKWTPAGLNRQGTENFNLLTTLLREIFEKVYKRLVSEIIPESEQNTRSFSIFSGPFLIASSPGNDRQAFHQDGPDTSRFDRMEKTANLSSFSCFWGLERTSRLWIATEGRKDDILCGKKKVPYNKGHLLVIKSSTIHAGAAWSEKNKRSHHRIFYYAGLHDFANRDQLWHYEVGNSYKKIPGAYSKKPDNKLKFTTQNDSVRKRKR